GPAYRALVLAPRIADDGSVSFAETTRDLDPDAPPYSIWRWSAGAGAERIATLEPGFWQLELRANGAGDLAWQASGFDMETPCAEDEELPGRLVQRLYVLPRDGTPALLAATDMPAPGAETFTIQRFFFSCAPQ